MQGFLYLQDKDKIAQRVFQRCSVYAVYPTICIWSLRSEGKREADSLNGSHAQNGINTKQMEK